jgi:hypothetical protein
LRACLKKGSRQVYFLVEENSKKKLMERKAVLHKNPLALVKFYEQRVIFTGSGSK